jgi:mannose-6-phosphate isomerase-like protein (cupin superfamily)
VSKKAYEVAHLDDLDRYPLDDEGLLWRPVRRRLGITAFGTNAYTAERGTERVVEEHSEEGGHEELYYVASGRATFVLGDEEIDAPAGTFVHAEPGTRRGAVATEPDTTVLAIGAKPGVPHEISKWEDIFVVFGLYRSGREGEAREHLETVVAENPDVWQGYYNAACFEALTGNDDAAIAHLQKAVELDQQALEYAQDDSDFDGLRDRPDFPS